MQFSFLESKPWLKSVFSWAFQIALFVILYYLVTLWQERGLLPSNGSTKAPDFSLVSTEGVRYSLNDLNAKNSVVYFFATWCGVCRLSMGNLQNLYEETDHQKLSVVAIALDWESVEIVKKYKTTHDLTFPVLLGGPNVSQAYLIKGFPTYYILDQQHKIAHVSMGYSSQLGMKLKLNL